jgi:hypothetical protein
MNRSIKYGLLRKSAKVGAFEITIAYDHDRPVRRGRWCWRAESEPERIGEFIQSGHYLSGFSRSEDGARRAVRKALVNHAIKALWAGNVR